MGCRRLSQLRPLLAWEVPREDDSDQDVCVVVPDLWRCFEVALHKITKLAEREAARDRSQLLDEKGDDANDAGSRIVEIRKTVSD